MQPQNSSPSPGPQYDFMVNDPGQKPGRRLPLPNLPRGAWIALIGSVGVLLIMVLAVAIFGNNSTSSNNYVDAMARSQEIIRVSNLVQTEATDPLVAGLATTAEVSLTSSNALLSAHLTGSGAKLNPAELNTYLNEGTDAQLAEARQNNRLPEVFALYLKNSLAAYQNSLNSAYGEATGPVQETLKEAYDSADVILKSSIVAKAQDS